MHVSTSTHWSCGDSEQRCRRERLLSAHTDSLCPEFVLAGDVVLNAPQQRAVILPLIVSRLSDYASMTSLVQAESVVIDVWPRETARYGCARGDSRTE